MEDIKKILVSVATDDEQNYKLMTWASRLSDLMGAKIEVLHVIDPKVEEQISEIRANRFITYDSYFATEELVQSDADVAEVRMAQLRTDFRLPQNNCHILKGHIADTVVDFAEENEFDMVVVGIRGQYGLLNNTFNSEALKIMSHLECPVLLVPDHAPMTKSEQLHVIFATDLRNESELYLAQALQWSHSVQASTFTALHVVPERSQLSRIWDGFRSLVIDDDHQASIEHHEQRARVKADLRRQLKRVAHDQGLENGLRLSSMALEGDVCEEVTRAVRRTLANIVCVGRHAFFHLDDASFGKIPFKRLGEFGVPVLVCREVFAPSLTKDVLINRVQSEATL